MTKPEVLIREIRQLSPDEIRRRLADISAEEKALRYLLRTRLNAQPKQQEARLCRK